MSSVPKKADKLNLSRRFKDWYKNWKKNPIIYIDLVWKNGYPDSKVHGAHLGPTGPRWAPCWPHELCYLGTILLRPEWIGTYTAYSTGHYIRTYESVYICTSAVFSMIHVIYAHSAQAYTRLDTEIYKIYTVYNMDTSKYTYITSNHAQK